MRTRDLLEEFYGIEKRTLRVGHDEVDWVEVFATSEASRQICFWICRSVELTAERAKES